MQWFNEPSEWEDRGDLIDVIADAKTDFWRKTHDGLIRDNGHFRFQKARGQFVAEVQVRGMYAALYDQAGLMVRENERVWMKCGVELVDGAQQASVVVTRDYSDWSLLPLPQNPPTLWLRVLRTSSAIEVYCSLDGSSYDMLRQAYLSDAEHLMVGPMCASPLGDGFHVVFQGLSIHST